MSLGLIFLMSAFLTLCAISSIVFFSNQLLTIVTLPPKKYNSSISVKILYSSIQILPTGSVHNETDVVTSNDL